MSASRPPGPCSTTPTGATRGATLQRWTQIVGKVRLALTPWLNHGWQVPLYVSARGLGTSPIHAGGGVFEIDFDFVDHRLRRPHVRRAPTRGFALGPMSVAAFYRRFLAELAAVGVDVAIHPRPNEVRRRHPFADDDAHARLRPARGARASGARWSQADACSACSAPAFLGKASPVHFFWGGFDLAVTRFSGRAAPLHPGGIPGLPDSVTREAYSHEVSSAGFWPGSDALSRRPPSTRTPIPRRAASRRRASSPAGARLGDRMGEWLLPYERVRSAADPDAALLRFLEAPTAPQPTWRTGTRRSTARSASPGGRGRSAERGPRRDPAPRRSAARLSARTVRRRRSRAGAWPALDRAPGTAPLNQARASPPSTTSCASPVATSRSM